MKHILIVSVLCAASLNIHAQKTNGIITNHSNYQRLPYGFVTELPMAKPETVGDYYLDDAWLEGNIYLADHSMLADLSFKYNLKENVLEIKVNDAVKVLPADRVSYFEYLNNNSSLDGIYINAGGYTSQGASLVGFFKIVYDGEYDLYMKTDLSVIPSTYNAALDVGERNNKIVKNKTFYLAKDSNVLRIETNKKKFIKDVKSFSGKDLEDFMRDRKIGTKDADDLTAIAEKLSSS